MSLMEKVSRQFTWTSALLGPSVWETLAKQTPNQHIRYSSLAVSTDYEAGHSILQFLAQIYPWILS